MNRKAIGKYFWDFNYHAAPVLPRDTITVFSNKDTIYHTFPRNTTPNPIDYTIALKIYDIYGNDLIRTLSSNNVGTENVKVIDGTFTGVAMITVIHGDNSIIVAPGANAELSCDIIEDMKENLKQASILVVQLEIPLETVRRVVDIANKYNVRILLNPAPASKLDDELLSHIDIITPNETECSIITGLPMDSIDDYKSAVSYLNKKGVKFVACNNALKGFNIKEDTLFDFVDIVPAGVMELVKKQSEGYLYIKP
jgi:sugar/nucleoside kinase (ribokinase family)